MALTLDDVLVDDPLGISVKRSCDHYTRGGVESRRETGSWGGRHCSRRATENLLYSSKILNSHRSLNSTTMSVLGA